MQYIPDEKLLNSYANVMINYALGNGQGVRPGQIVFAEAADFAMPMLGALQRTILKAGAFPFLRIMPSQFEAEYMTLADEAQLAFFPAELWQGVFRNVDHRVYMKPFELLRAYQGIPAPRVGVRQNSLLKFRPFQNEKEAKGLLSWTLAWWGTDAYAAEAGMTLQEYWEQIAAACFLNDADPIASWRKVSAETHAFAKKLDAMPIRRLHVLSEGTDIWITLGDHRRWRTGTGNNTPSFEIYTSPDARFTTGKVTFNQPLFYNGLRISGITLVFQDGNIVYANAVENNEALLALIAEPDALKIGEFSLTDARHSNITRSMCCTLYDENVQGNMHMAIGAAYRATYRGDQSAMSAEDWAELGFNNVDATTHVDIVTTAPRIVEADLGEGQPVVIYSGNQFVI